MRQRAIANTTVTVVGLGDLSLVTADARGLSATDVERALHEALELGITLVDVAAEADAERLCGEAVRALRLRDRVLVATRVPLEPKLPTTRLVQERIEASLRASRLEALPLAQLPVRSTWLAESAWPELAGTCARLVREGKVLRWAAALELDDVEPFALGEPFAAVAIRYSACERAAAAWTDGALPVLARAPLAGGALAGTLGPGVKLPPRDDRRVLDEPQLEAIAVACAKLAPLVRTTPPAARSCDAARAVLASPGFAGARSNANALRRSTERGRRPPDVEATSLADLALRYVIDRGAIALPRLHRREHVAPAIAAAAAAPLAGDVVAWIEDSLG